MYTFKLFGGYGYRTYADPFEQALDNLGVTWFTGESLDSKKGSNGSGKSSFVLGIPKIFYAPLTDSDMYSDKNCLLFIHYTYKKKLYEIYMFRKLDKKNKDILIAKFKKRKVKNLNEEFKPSGYKIFINNKDVTKHGIPACRKQIKTIFTLTEDEFFGYVCASPGKASILINGSSADRRKYFEKVFSILQSYKLLQEKIGNKYDKIEEKVKKLNEYKIQVKTIKEQLAEYKDIGILKHLVKDLTEKCEEVEEERNRLDDEIREIENKVYGNKKRKEVEKQLSELDNVTKKQYKKYKNTLEELKSEETKLNRMRVKVENKEEAEEQLDSLKKEIKKQNVDLEKNYKQMYDNASECYSENNSILKDAKKLFRHYEELKTDKCPTCRQEIDRKFISKQIKKYKERIDGYTKSKEKNAEEKSNYEEIIDLVKDYKRAEAHADSLQSKTDKRTVSGIDKRLTQIKKDKKQCEQTLKIFNKRQTIEKMLKKYPKQKLPKKSYYTKIKEKSGDLDIDVKTTIKEKTEYSFQLNQLKKLSKKVDKYELELIDYKKLSNKLQILGVLWDAYGDKGLKVVQIINLCKRLITQLPKYTGLMFQEKNIKFTHNLKKETFDIIMHRTFNGKKKSIDIKELSSGEKKRFIPALMLAQNDLLHSSKRTNLFIADELDANLDQLAKNSFANNIVPVLKKKFSSVIVIAHSDEMYSQQYDKHWHVIKKKGRSVLHEQKLQHGS